MTLREHQELFARLLPRLLDRVPTLGLTCTLGELERPREWAKVMWQRRRGTLTSLHMDRLAIDVHLFRDGEYLALTEDHAELGAFWKTLHPLCRWGGDFKSRPDGNHYSISYQGRA